jgi:hypothetical protein
MKTALAELARAECDNLFLKSIGKAACLAAID